MTFFLIDDDVDEHELFMFALEQLDHPVDCITSTDCREALERLLKKEAQPDFIFLDLNMPMMSGRECLCKLKATADLKHIPVVIFTTSSDPKDIADTREMGAHDFITKPSRISDLSQLLKTFIKS